MKDGKVEVGDVLRGDEVVVGPAARGDRIVEDILRPEHLGPMTDEIWLLAQRLEHRPLHVGRPRLPGQPKRADNRGEMTCRV